MGTEELETEKKNSYDAVVSGLCFSELSRDKIRFTLKQLKRIIKPDGFLLIADDAVPETTIKHFIYAFFRIPLLLVTYIFTGTITNPDKTSPVFLTCNYAVTVERVKKALTGTDCYLLIANSHGINGWCAFTGGHLTNHPVISALTTNGIENLVDHRKIIPPQLAAAGIEPGVN